MHAFWDLGAKGLIFDKDGTLINTEILWYEACDRLLQEYGAKHDTVTHRLMMGGGLAQSLAPLRERHQRLPWDEAWGRDFVDKWRNTFILLREEIGVSPMPGVVPFIEVCREQGIPLAVATSGNRHDTEAEFRGLRWERMFHATVTIEDVAERKPAPDAYLEAARRLFLPPSQCIAFEDSLNGVKSAHAAGMKVVFVRDPQFEIPPPPEATIVVSSFLEFLD